MELLKRIYFIRIFASKINYETGFLISYRVPGSTKKDPFSSDFLQDNDYNNSFWNGSALYKTNQGNAFQMEVCWKGALAHCVRGEWRGDKMSHYIAYKNEPPHIVLAGEKMTKDDGGFTVARPELKPYDQEMWWRTDMLPEPLRHNSGHGGSHTFITHEYISAILEDREPEVDIYEALAYTAPGIVGHQSALNDGESMRIPNFDKD